MISIMMDSITSGQMSYALGKFPAVTAHYGGLNGLLAVLQQVVGVMENIVNAFYQQIITKVTKMKTNPKITAQPNSGLNDILFEIYYMANAYVTNNTVKTYVQIVGQPNNLSPANWSNLVADFSDIIICFSYAKLS